MPEYGRSVQNMVDHALTIQDRAERQRCAQTIINIMGSMFPHLRDVPDFKHKLWDHLAIMADFKLDIDYPFPVVRPEEMAMKPKRLAYPQGKIRYRHYGRILAEMVKRAKDIEDERLRKQYINLLALQMKKSFTSWNKEGVDDYKIAEDLYEYSDGLINVRPEELRLNGGMQPRMYYNNNQRKQNNNQRRQNNNQRKKY